MRILFVLAAVVVIVTVPPASVAPWVTGVALALLSVAVPRPMAAV